MIAEVEIETAETAEAAEAAETAAAEITKPIVIQPVSYHAILAEPNAPSLIQAYAASCIVSDAAPQWPLYERMEQAGILHCFAAYSGNLLIGFASVICSIMPHDGHLVATLGEMFIDALYRQTDAENLLLSALEQQAITTGCRCFICSARKESRYSKRLEQREGFQPTHTQFTKWLNGYGEGK
jgi:GNAT superfamily N-acetyltransferase